MTATLTVNNLSVTYGADLALDDVSVVLDAGTVVGLIGPNGAGKTSFIKALCGRVDIASGAIKINGETLKSGTARQTFMGLVPQDIGLYDHMTARENLYVFAQMMGVSKRDRTAAVDHALARVELTDRGDTRVAALSGGMKRRINVAAAIMHNPSLLIMDEPTAGVDVAARDAVHKLARDLASSGLCVLLVTHELDEAESVCDRVLLLSRGRLLADATPDDLLARCYKGQRELTLRFSRAPDDVTKEHLHEYGMREGEHPTTWMMFTRKNESESVSDAVAVTRNTGIALRDISAGRPGLSALVRHVEKTGELPC